MNFDLGDSMFGRLLALHQLNQLRAGSNSSDHSGPIIRDLDDGDSNAAGSSLASSFEQTLQLEERSSSYMEEGKHEEAYGLVKKQYKLGSKVHFIPVLVNYYATLMHTDRPEKAMKIRDELALLLEESFESSPEDVANYGDKLRKQKKLFEAILFYQIASNQCKRDLSPGDAISALQSCALGTKLAVTTLIEGHKTSKLLVKKHIVPPLHKIIDRIGIYTSVDRKLTCIVQAICLHHVEHCEYLVGDLKARETSIQKAIDLMKQHLGSDAEKHHLYGGCLNNLGHSYLVQDRPNDAARLFAQAVVAKQKAEDYDTAAEKREDIKKSELALQLARRQL